MVNILAAIAVEIEPILDDDKILSISANIKPVKNEPRIDYGRRTAKVMLGVAQLLTGDHKQAFSRILAAFFQCTEEELGKKSIKEIMAQIKDSLNDEALLDFFPQLGSFVQNEPSDT